MKKICTISVFDYTNFRDYLRDYYTYYSNHTSYFSYRYFSNKAGFKSHNVLKQAINGERNIGKKSIHKFSLALSLNENESNYFETLVNFNQSTNDNEKQDYFKELTRYREGAKTRNLTELQFRFFTEWYHPAVRELITCGCKSAEDIAIKIAPPVGRRKVQDSLDLMCELELIEIDENGKYTQTDKTISTTPELKSLTVRKHNQAMIELAKRSIVDHPRESREVSGMTLGISREQFNSLKIKIQKFKEELLQDVITDSSPSELVYQLNFQLFPLTNEKVSK